MIAVAILTTAVVFILRSFTAAIAAAKVSQNISRACILAENRLFWVENNLPVPEETEPRPQDKTEFTITQELSDADIRFPELKLLIISISWNKAANRPYSLDFLTYAFTENK